MNDTDRIEELETVLERFADHRNWIDGRYAPVIAEIYDHPADIAAAVLREN